MNKRQELIDELIKANEDGTYKTYKSTEEIKAMNNEEILDYIFHHEKLSIRQKNTHKLLTPIIHP